MRGLEKVRRWCSGQWTLAWWNFGFFGVVKRVEVNCAAEVTSLPQVMLVVSTVEPLALGGEEAGEGQEGGEARQEKREGREKREAKEEKRDAKEERREDEGLAMESPSKRIRLSSAEEEPGPCDSQDTGAQVGE